MAFGDRDPAEHLRGCLLSGQSVGIGQPQARRNAPAGRAYQHRQRGRRRTRLPEPAHEAFGSVATDAAVDDLGQRQLAEVLMRICVRIDSREEREGARLRRSLRFVLELVDDEAVQAQRRQPRLLLGGDCLQFGGGRGPLGRRQPVKADPALAFDDLW